MGAIIGIIAIWQVLIMPLWLKIVLTIFCAFSIISGGGGVATWDDDD